MRYSIHFRAIARHKFFTLSGIMFLVSSFFLFASPVQASNASVARPQAGTSNSVTVLILDMSGSMGLNDPQGYRCSAANAFIDMSGVGNYIGVIGLDGNGARGGPHNFALAQQWTPDPVDMSVLSNRNGLKNTIKQDSHNCAPDSITPTYDALNKALQMLEDSAGNNEIPGSVVLLTDGEPDDGGPSDAAAQINAIQADLLPQFRQHQWPIDTVALGQNAPVSESRTPFATFHDFLQGVSNATGGVAYDDGNGIAPGITPLNIAPFFADIFARHNQRTLTNNIGVTPVVGNQVKRNFDVAPYTNHLDIITVKDHANTQVTLLDSNGRVVTPQQGIALYQDTYYVIFSIDNPQPGTWELDVQGTGQFLMESLNKSTLGLASPSISQNGLINTGTTQSFASGQTLTIKTQLTNQGNPVIDPTTYTVIGSISYNGVAGTYSQPFTLHPDTSGTYTGTVTIPDDKPTGSYNIEIKVSTGSLDNVLTSRTFTIRIGAFPVPLLFSQNGTPTAEPVTTQVVQWDPVLNLIYSYLPGFLNQWALQGHLAGQAVLPGQVTLRHQAYSGASITANVTHQGASNTDQAITQSDSNGNFSLQFPALTSGVYTVAFNTSGTFADTHGDFGITQNTVNLTLVASNPGQELVAWAWTLLYLWCLICLLNLVRFAAVAHPFGGLVQSQDGEVKGRFAFNRARRNPFKAYFRPNVVHSREANLPPGLVFRFKHRGGIEVRPEAGAGRNWQSADGGSLRQEYQEVRELRYSPPGMDESDEGSLGISTYVVKSKITGGPSRGNDDDEEHRSSSRARTSRKSYTSRTRQPARSRKKSSSEDYDDYNDLYDY